MSITTELSYREAQPVTISGVTVYCERFRAFSARNINEESTVDGNTVITGNAIRNTRLVFYGRVCTEDSPEAFILNFNQLVHSASAFTVDFMGLSFPTCRMFSYSFDSKDGDWADVTVTLVTSDTIIRSNGA